MCDHPHREEAMVVLGQYGRGTVVCDPCIAPLVKALNEGGLLTIASCCGHGKIAGSVILDDGRWIHIRQGTVVDGDWEFDLPFTTAPALEDDTRREVEALAERCLDEATHLQQSAVGMGETVGILSEAAVMLQRAAAYLGGTDGR